MELIIMVNYRKKLNLICLCLLPRKAFLYACLIWMVFTSGGSSTGLHSIACFSPLLISFCMFTNRVTFMQVAVSKCYLVISTFMFCYLSVGLHLSTFRTMYNVSRLSLDRQIVNKWLFSLKKLVTELYLSLYICGLLIHILLKFTIYRFWPNNSSRMYLFESTGKLSRKDFPSLVLSCSVSILSFKQK